MNESIKARIAGNAYDFMRENPLFKNIIYLVASGSHGYGTNISTSDVDLRGALIEPQEHIFGLNDFEQFENLETDTVIYGLKKFVSLCANANPNTLELLGVDEDSIIIMNKAGELLRNNAELFLSQKVINSFGNYATAQLRRLQNALARDSSDIQKEQHILNTLKGQMEHFKEKYTEFENGSIQLYIDRAINEDSDSKIVMDISLKNYPLRDFNNIYSEMANIVKMYSKINHRNRKKDDAHLYKHAMHLIRLLITGIDILNGKGIITNRKEEKEFLLDIRNGKYTYDKIFELVDSYEEKFNDASQSTKLSLQLDMKKIEKLMLQIYDLYY